MLRDERLLEAVPVRAFLDLDPGFNQVWQATGSEMGFDLHTHCVTVGVRIGAEDCPIPTLGRTWIPTLPPVALAHWPLAEGAPDRDAFTSVGHWRSYGSIEHDGVHYGQRAHSLRGLVDLPRRSGARFELALGIHPDEVDDLEALRENGWELARPRRGGRRPRPPTPSFVRGSKAELAVAKSGYVASRSGWFSDRSACYLASGRPVVAQDTGFGDSLPVGEGLLGFATAEEAAAAVAAVESDPERHGRAARAAGRGAPRLAPGPPAPAGAVGAAVPERGGPVSEPIPFNRPFVSGGELAYLEEAIAARDLAGGGEFTRRCEEWLRETDRRRRWRCSRTRRRGRWRRR